MEKFAVTALLLAALALPVALFLVLGSRLRLNAVVAAGIAIAAGWALNIAWAFASQQIAVQGPSHADADTLSIAAHFGWVCPTVLVFLAWLVRRFVARRRPA